MDSKGPTREDLASLRRLAEGAKPPRRPREVNYGRVGAFAAAAIVAIALPWVVVASLGDSGPVVPRSASSPSPAASPAHSSPSPTALPDAGLYEIVGEVECVNVRIEPGTQGELVNCLKPGTQVRSDGRIQDADGLGWLHIEDPFRKIDGWVAIKYVRRAPPPSPGS